jgi:hypothetical protein
MSAAETTPPAATDALLLTDVFPPTALVGRCHGCAQLVLAHDPHDWADRASRELCWPHEHGAALYCGTCSNEHERAARPVSIRYQDTSSPGGRRAAGAGP